MFFYVFLFLFGIASSKWKIKILNDTTLYLQPGEFYPINIKLELDSDTSNPYKAITNLYLKGDPVITSESFYEINSFIKVNYIIYIGVPCSTSNGQYQLDFIVNNTEDFTVETNQTIEIISRERPIKVSIHLLNNKISAYTYSMYYILSPNLVNVDPIAFSFSNNTLVDSKIENKIMPPYSTKNPRSFRGLYQALSESTSDQSYSVSINNTCFQLLNETVTFKIIEYKEKNITTYKTSIIKQFSNFKRYNSSISFNLVIPISPTIVNCIAIANSNIFPSDDEIRKGYLFSQATPYQKYFNYFILEAQQEITVNFSDLSSFRKYRIKCIVDSAVINEANRTSAIVTIGEFYNSDILIDTTPNPTLPLVTQCITFNFTGDVGLNEFNNKIIDYCENFFYKEHNKPSSLNGCVRCIKRNIPIEDKNKSGICIIGEEICDNNYQNNINRDVQKFKWNLIDTDAIKTELNIVNISDLVNSTIESDYFEEPDNYNEYIFGYSENLDKIIPNETVNLTFKSLYTEKNFDCFLLNFNVTIPYINLTKEDFLNNSINIILKKKQSENCEETQIEVAFEEKNIDNNIYPIIVKCFPLSYTDYRINESPSLLLSSFLRTNITIPDDTLVPKKNCSNYMNKLESECLNRKYYKRRNFIYYNKDSLYMNEDLTSLKDSFSHLDYRPQKIKVIIEEEKFHILPEYSNVTKDNFEQYLKQHILVNELLQICDCNSFPGFETCKSWKQSIASNLTKHIFKFIKLKNYTTFLNSTLSLIGSLGDEGYYNKVMLLYIALYELTTNPEAIAKTTLPDINRFSNYMFDSINNFTSNNTETSDNHRENVLYIMLSTYFNLIEISKFETIYIKDQDIENAKFISDAFLMNMYNKVQDIYIMIINYISIPLIQIFYNENLIHLFNPSSSKKESIFKQIGDGYVKIELDPFALINGEKNSTIQYIAVTIYDVYPFLSEEDESTLGTFISIKGLSKSGVVNIDFIPPTHRPEILFDNDYTTDTSIEYKYIKCIFIDQNLSGEVDMKKIESTILGSGEQQIKCVLSRTGDFTLQRGYVISNYKVWIIISIIVVIVIGTGIALFFVAKKNVKKALRNKKRNFDDSSYKTINSDEEIEENIEENQTSSNKNKNYNFDDL